MSKTPITPSVLKEHGFSKMRIDGKTYYAKGNVGLVHSTEWQPCNLDTGVPLSTALHISTWEELERLVIEGGITME